VLRSGPFLRLLGAHGLATLGQLQLTLAVGIDALARTGSGVWVSIAVAVGFVPYLVCSVPAGLLVDRCRRTTVLRLSIGLRVATGAAATAGLMLGWTVPVVVLVAALTAVLATPSYPAVVAATPQLVPAPRLGQANTLVTGVENGAWVAGPGLLGLLLLVGAPVAGGGLAATLCFLVGLVVLGRLSTAAAAPAGSRGAQDGLLAGFRVLNSEPAIRRAMVLAGLVNLLYGFLVVAMVLLVEDELGGGPQGIGLLNAAFTAGALLSMLVTWRLSYTAERARRTVVMGMLGFCGTVLLLAGAEAAALAAVLIFGAGLLNLVVEVVAVTIIQTSAQEAVLGRLFGVYDAIAVGLIALGSGLAGPLVEAVGVPAALVAAAAATAVPTALVGRQLLRDPVPAAAAAGLAGDR
jgi:MFS family permease